MDLNEGLGETKDVGVNQIKKYALNILRRWPYILSFFILCEIAAYIYNRYQDPVYLIKGRITTKKFSGKHSNMVPGLIDASFFLSGLTEVYEEIPILKSPKRIEATIDKIDLWVSYYSKGIIKSVQSNQGFGFYVDIDSLKQGSAPYRYPIFVNRLSEKEFELNIENQTWSKVVSNKRFRFGAPIKLGTAVIRIINTNGKTAEHDKYYFVLNRKSDLVSEYARKIQIDWAMKGSAMLDLQLQSQMPERDLKFMNAFYEVIDEMGMAEKNETLDNTIKFIDEQMKFVNDSLNYYQSLVDGTKLGNRDLPIGSEDIFSRLNDLDREKANIILGEQYLDYLMDYFNTKGDGEVFAPSIIGLNVPLLDGWVNQFISSKMSEKDFANNENSKNPLIIREDSSKQRLVKGIFESVNNERIRHQGLLKEIKKKEDLIFNGMKAGQMVGRDLGRYQRLYQLNNSLFDLFIRRRTEAAISKASATPDYKVIDQPTIIKSPIKPDKTRNLLIAAVIGLIFPLGFFMFLELTNSRIRDRDDLSAITDIPFLGNIAHSDYESNLVVNDHPRSVVAESFRAVRANLKFLTANVSGKNNTFLVTSSVGGEGKTFCSLNLAYTLALSQRKTIVIGADLRKPELGNYLRIRADKGLSTYLAGFAQIEDIIIQGQQDRPDFIDAGEIPPNPSELLGNNRMQELITYLKERYSYIIIDTAPIGLVSDCMELFKFSDYNVLIVRHDTTPKDALKMINELYLEGKIKNFTVLFNDLKLIKKANSYYSGYLYGMGYSGYGYGYYDEDKGKKGRNG